jgi:hypothetical protein
MNSKGKENKKIKYGDNTYLIFALIFFVFAFFLGLLFIDSMLSKNQVKIDYRKLGGFTVLLFLGLLNLLINRILKRKADNK